MHYVESLALLALAALIIIISQSGCATSTTRLGDCADVCDAIARKHSKGMISITTEKHECKCDVDLGVK